MPLYSSLESRFGSGKLEARKSTKNILMKKFENCVWCSKNRTLIINQRINNYFEHNLQLGVTNLLKNSSFIAIYW